MKRRTSVAPGRNNNLVRELWDVSTLSLEHSGGVASGRFGGFDRRRRKAGGKCLPI